jgi:hypothetical protein
MDANPQNKSGELVQSSSRLASSSASICNPQIYFEPEQPLATVCRVTAVYLIKLKNLAIPILYEPA